MNVQASSGNGSPRLLIIIISFIVKNASLLHEIKARLLWWCTCPINSTMNTRICINIITHEYSKLLCLRKYTRSALCGWLVWFCGKVLLNNLLLKIFRDCSLRSVAFTLRTVVVMRVCVEEAWQISAT